MSRILEKVAKSGGERQDNDGQNETGLGENNAKVEKATDQNREMDRENTAADVKDVSSAPPVNEVRFFNIDFSPKNLNLYHFIDFFIKLNSSRTCNEDNAS